MGVWDILTRSHSLYLVPTELVFRLQESYYIDSFQWPIGGDRPISGIPLYLMTYHLVPPAVTLITPQPNFADSTHTRGLLPVTGPCNYSPEKFAQRDWSQGLVPRTVYTKCFEEPVKLVWIHGTSRKDQSWSLQLDF